MAYNRLQHLRDNKVDDLVEKYQKEIREIAEQVPQLQAMQGKPFEKEAELRAMKSELSRLEREIAHKIKEKQEAQQEQQLPIEMHDAKINTKSDLQAEEGKNHGNDTDAKVVDIRAAEAKTPLEHWGAPTAPDGKALKEPMDQVFKKTKGVRL